MAAGLIAWRTRHEIHRRLSRALGSSSMLPSDGVLGFVLFALPPAVFVAVGAAVFGCGLLRLF